MTMQAVNILSKPFHEGETVDSAENVEGVFKESPATLSSLTRRNECDKIPKPSR